MATKKTKAAKKKKVKKKTDLEILLDELQARFDAVEDKLDAILSKSAGLARMISTERDPGFQTHATVSKKFPVPRDRDPRERKMYKVVCAECKKECEVPFEPKAGRPVYCKTCYSSRKNGTAPKSLPDREEIVAEIAKTLKLDIAEPPKPKSSKAKKSASRAPKSKKAASGPSKTKKTKAKTKASKAKKPKAKKTKARK